MDLFKLTLCNPQNDQYSLLYRLYETSTAQTWLKTLIESQALGLRESRRFYNFPGNQLANTDWLVRIKNDVKRIHAYRPGLIPENISAHNEQDYVNQIHVYFTEAYRQVDQANPQLWEVWTELNNDLHGYESFLRSARTEALAGIPEANLVVTWNRQVVTPLGPADYAQFTLAKKFGQCYLGYSHVGRHLYEMFLADDEVSEGEDILPMSHLTADSYFWFGSTTGPKSLENRNQKLKKWFSKHEEKLSKLGFHWGDPRLALGWPPIAELLENPGDLKSQLALIRKISLFPEVHSIVPV